MTRNYLESPRTFVRREDRAVNDTDWIKSFLASTPMGTLATVYDGQPFLNANLFVYDAEEHVIYMHTARVGRTQANLEQKGPVCFTVSEIGRLLPADTALEFSVEYASVVVFGRGHVVADRDEARNALQQLLDKYAPHLKPERDYRPITLDELKRTAVFRIDIEDWTAKRKQVESDFPGAFEFQYENTLSDET